MSGSPGVGRGRDREGAGARPGPVSPGAARRTVRTTTMRCRGRWRAGGALSPGGPDRGAVPSVANSMRGSKRLRSGQAGWSGAPARARAARAAWMSVRHATGPSAAARTHHRSAPQAPRSPGVVAVAPRGAGAGPGVSGVRLRGEPPGQGAGGPGGAQRAGRRGPGAGPGRGQGEVEPRIGEHLMDGCAGVVEARAHEPGGRPGVGEDRAGPGPPRAPRGHDGPGRGSGGARYGALVQGPEPVEQGGDREPEARELGRPAGAVKVLAALG